jgi:hypothetical protein
MNLTDALGWTLLHFLWQGALIALLFAAADAALCNALAKARYAAACAAMLLMLVCAGAAFVTLGPSSAGAGIALEQPSEPASTPAGVPTGATSLSPVRSVRYLEWLTYLWLAGVCALSLRSLGGWVALQQFKRREARPAAHSLPGQRPRRPYAAAA